MGKPAPHATKWTLHLLWRPWDGRTDGVQKTVHDSKEDALEHLAENMKSITGSNWRLFVAWIIPPKGQGVPRRLCRIPGSKRRK